MSTSIKGRHSIDAEINADSFEYVNFPKIETVFVVQFFKVWRYDTEQLGKPTLAH